jgi:co-chaperonin GroES (HSP10)
VSVKSSNPLHLKVGDEVIVHYLTFYDHSYNLQRGFVVNGERVWSISYPEIFAVIRDGEIKPVGEYILGEAIIEKEFTSSFLVIPDGVGEKINDRMAKVLMPAPDATIDVAPGDKVLLLSHSHYKIEFNGKTYLRFRESEVIGLCR